MNKLGLVVVFFGCCVLTALPAAAVVVDFEDTGPFPNISATITSGGFDFIPADGTVATMFNGGSCSPSCAANGTATFIAGGIELSPPTIHPVTMLSSTGFAFFLTALDFAEFVGADEEFDATDLNATQIVMTGNLAGGGTVSQTLFLDGLNDGPGGFNDFQTAVLLPFWASSTLSSLEFVGFNDTQSPTTPRGFQLDNIHVDQVPEPGTMALLGLGLISLGFRRARSR